MEHITQNSQIKFQTTMPLKLSLCDYSNAHILVKETMAITRGTATATDSNKQLEERKNGVIPNWLHHSQPCRQNK